MPEPPTKAEWLPQKHDLQQVGVAKACDSLKQGCEKKEVAGHEHIIDAVLVELQRKENDREKNEAAGFQGNTGAEVNRQTAANAEEKWVQCDHCSKWRIVTDVEYDKFDSEATVFRCEDVGRQCSEACDSLEQQRKENRDNGCGYITDAEAEQQRDENRGKSYGYITDAEAEQQRDKNNAGCWYMLQYITDAEVEQQRNKNEDAGQDHFSNHELNQQRDENEADGRGYITDAEANQECDENEDAGRGYITDAEVEQERDNNAGCGCITDAEVEQERVENEDAGRGYFTNRELEEQCEDNEDSGYGHITDAERDAELDALEGQRDKNRDDGYGHITDAELDALEGQRDKNRDDGCGHITDAEVKMQRKENGGNGRGYITDVEVKMQRKENGGNGRGYITDAEVLELQRELYNTVDPMRVRDLLNKGTSPNIAFGDGCTSLHYAAYEGHYDKLVLLLRARADISILDDDGKTALQYAEERGKQECAHALQVETLTTITVHNVETGEDEQKKIPLKGAVAAMKRQREHAPKAAAVSRAEVQTVLKKIKVERDDAKQKAAAAEDDAEYQEEETKTMQIFSGKQTLAIERLVQLAKDAGVDTTAIKAAAKVL